MFRLLFGNSVEKPYAAPPSARDLFGWAVAYARTARACIERGRWWQAEYCISAIRDHALTLACCGRELPTSFGRGFDDLPPEALAAFEDALIRSLEREELLRALTRAVEGLLRESTQVGEMATNVEPRLRELLTVERD